jgi:hypothetical protein
VVPHVLKVNKFFVSVCTCGITPILLFYTSLLSRVCLVSRPAMSLELGLVVRAVINTVHIQLQDNVIWSVCCDFIVILLAVK